jgi:hypothetical protein
VKRRYLKDFTLDAAFYTGIARLIWQHSTIRPLAGYERMYDIRRE